MKEIIKKYDNYNIHLIKTNNFKTVRINMYLRLPIIKEELTINKVLSNILFQGNKTYNTKRLMNIKCEDLYLCRVYSETSRYGKYLINNICLEVLNDKYTEKGNLEESINYLSDIIFNPDINNKCFNEEKLKLSKNMLKDMYECEKDDPRSYAYTRACEVDSFDPSSYRIMGYINDLDKINTSNLYDYYMKLINNSMVDIYITGDVEDSIIDLINEKFKFNNNDYDLEFNFENKNHNVVKYNEKINNKQSSLNVIYHMKDLNKYEGLYVLPIYNSIFGGGLSSKLFDNIREKHSLCYSIVSSASYVDNKLYVQSGIDNKNYDKTIKLIDKYFNEMIDGKFSEKDIDIAKKTFFTGLDGMFDSQLTLLRFFYNKNLGLCEDIDEIRKNIEKVSKEDIVNLAKKIKLSTIYNLEGVDEDEI